MPTETFKSLKAIWLTSCGTRVIIHRHYQPITRRLGNGRDFGIGLLIAHQLESTAFIYKALEHTDKATRLLGAAETLREKIKIDMNMQERKEYDKEFASLWGEGRSMTMDEAIELALEESGIKSN